jgi:hypothetical protein
MLLELIIIMSPLRGGALWGLPPERNSRPAYDIIPTVWFAPRLLLFSSYLACKWEADPRVLAKWWGCCWLLVEMRGD